MIRDAKFTDIPAIVGVMQDAMARSHYAGGAIGDIDVPYTKKLLVTAIQRHGHKNGGACWVQVAETAGIITGFIVGTLDRVYAVGTRLMATDLFWLTSPNVEPMDSIALMRGMVAWAESCPQVVEIKCGATTTVNDDAMKAGKILERLGLERYGVIFRKEIVR